MAYLVTGGTGYIGSYVVRELLKAGKEVVCLQRSGVTPTFREVVGEDNLDKVKVIQGDQSNTLQLFDIISEQGIDLIVDIGFLVPPASEEQPAYALQVNSVAFNNMLEAVRLFNLKRLVWTSSTNSLGRVAELYKEPIGDDDAIYRPSIMYGATKALNEFMARHYFDKFGVDSIGFRLPLTYGVGRWHGVFVKIMEFFRKAALNIPVTTQNPDEFQYYLYVEDASSVIAQACDIPTTKTRVFNIAEGGYTWRQVVETIHRINPEAQVVLEKEAQGLMTGYVLPRVNTTGIQRELGWQPKYSLEEGLRKVLNYFRQREGMPPL
jgi:nucleoside-diphosphate-sugar epimerase